MRKPLLTLAAVALVASACSGSTTASPGSAQGARPPDQHHVPTPDP
ncbi:MAG: hypothetical protein ABIQ58_04320 [Candidatus Limnocylindrales bacterium]